MHLVLYDDDGVLAIGVGAHDDVLLPPLHAQECHVVGVVKCAHGGRGDGDEGEEAVCPALSDVFVVFEARLVQDAAVVGADDEEAVNTGMRGDALERLVDKFLFTLCVGHSFLLGLFSFLFRAS